MLQLFSFLHHVNVHLRDSIFCLSIATTVIVFILLTVALLTFQKPKSQLGTEVVWAVIPFVMLFVMMIPIVNLIIYQQQEKPGIMTPLLDN